jgi:hypothetical protein
VNQDRLQAIQKEALEESKLYNADDAENQARVVAEAQAKAAAEMAATQAKMDAAAVEHQRKQQEAAKEAIDDAMAPQRAMEEEARKLTEDSKSASQKYADEIERINLLKAEGLITDQTAAAAKAKANGELLSAAGETDNRKFGAETRRFDFNIGQRDRPKDPMEALKQQQAKQLESAKKAEFYLQQLYQQGLADANPEVADF